MNKQAEIFDQLEGTPISRNKPEPPTVDPFKQRTDKQIVLGNIPAKSNCYRIIILRSKDPNKKSFHTPHASMAKSATLKQYEKDFVIQAGLYRNRNIQGKFELTVDVYFPSERSDLDNSLKVLLDCLQQIGAVANDNLCKRIIAEKYIDKANPRVEFSLKELAKTD